MPTIERGIWSYDPRAVKEAGRTRRAGWWFWYPLLFGILFGVMGVAFVVAGLSIPPARAGVYIGAISFFVMAAGSFAVALWARHDIRSTDADDQEAARKGAVTSARARELRDGGLAGRATLDRFVYLGDTNGDRTLVELHLQVTGGMAGVRPATHKEYVPLALTDRLQAGVTLPVLVDPADPSRLVIDWEAVAPGCT